MILRRVAATPKLLTLGDGVWTIEIGVTGCVDISIAGGRAHECDLQKVAALLLEARTMASKYFDERWPG